MSLASWLPGGLASSAESNDTTNMSDTDRNNADSASAASTSSTAPAPTPVSKLDDVVNSTAHHELVKAAIKAAAETRDEASYLQHFRSGLKVANIRALAGAVFQLQRKLVAADKANRELEAKVNNVDAFREVKHKGVGKKSVQAKPSPVVTKNPFQALVEREGDDVNDAEVNNADTAAPTPAVCVSIKERNESLCADKSKCSMAHPEQCRDYDNCWPTRRPDCALWHLAVPLSVHYRQIKERRRLEREKLKKVSATIRQAHDRAGNARPRGLPGPRAHHQHPHPHQRRHQQRRQQPQQQQQQRHQWQQQRGQRPPPPWKQQQRQQQRPSLRRRPTGPPPPPWGAGRINYDTEFPPLDNVGVNQTVAELLKALNNSRRITEPDNSYW